MPQEQSKRQDEQLRWVVGGWAPLASPVSLGLSSPARKGRAGMVTKPIIFTYLLLPASRHVILNGLSDPWAGFEPLENMVSQMKLSQETACIRQQAFQTLLTCRLLEHHGNWNLLNSHFLKQTKKERKKLACILFKDVITDSFVLKFTACSASIIFM